MTDESLSAPQPAAPASPKRFQLRLIHGAVGAISIVILLTLSINLLDWWHLRDLYHARFQAASSEYLAPENFAHKIIIMLFVRSRDPATPAYLQAFDYFAVAPQYHDELGLIGVITDGSSLSELQHFLQSANTHYPVVITTDQSRSAIPGFTRYPALTIMNRSGRILITHEGAVPVSQVRDELQLVTQIDR